MGTGYNFEQLKTEMLALSNSADWNQAKTEWELHSVVRVGEEQFCLCGHHPIFQICTLKNQVNTKLADVGNVCVEKFLGMRSKRIFSALKRVRLDANNNLNKDTLDIFVNFRLIGVQDRDYYISYYRKRVHITEDQKRHRLETNTKIIEHADTKARESEERYRQHGLRRG